MPTKLLPTSAEITDLVSFLPHLYSDGVTPINPIKQWQGGTGSLPWPDYELVVKDFFRAASAPCWCDYDYNPSEAGEMIRDKAFIKQASLTQIQTMLTFCVRGERFSDGHWGTMITKGIIRQLLQRLAEIEMA